MMLAQTLPRSVDCGCTRRCCGSLPDPTRRSSSSAHREHNAVVTCDIKLFWNNFEVISVFYFTCNHWNYCKIISLSETFVRRSLFNSSSGSLRRRLCHHSGGHWRPTFSAVPPVLINFRDVSAPHQSLFVLCPVVLQCVRFTTLIMSLWWWWVECDVKRCLLSHFLCFTELACLLT